jgi:WD repeat and SOF domain-containing protein 1
MTTKRCLRMMEAHDGYVRGVTFNSEGDHIISVADDKTIKTWNTDISDTDQPNLPLNTIISKVPF